MSECNVCFSDFSHGDGYEAQCYQSHMRTARKAHKCEECGSMIQRGDQYEYASGVFDGSGFSYKTCAPCSSIRGAYCCGGFLHGSLWDSMEQDVFDNPNFAMAGPCWDKLTAVGKAHLLDKWRRWKGLAA